jgi:hypothetical protein
MIENLYFHVEVVLRVVAVCLRSEEADSVSMDANCQVCRNLPESAQLSWIAYSEVVGFRYPRT